MYVPAHTIVFAAHTKMHVIYSYNADCSTFNTRDTARYSLNNIAQWVDSNNIDTDYINTCQNPCHV